MAAKKPMMPEISDAEWDVMNLLWQTGRPMTAAEVVDRLGDAGSEGTPRRRSPRTVKTFLNRLLGKGAITAEPVGNRYLYRPRVTRDQCVRAETRSFLSRVFAGEAGPMVVQFVRHAKLTPDEVTELKRLLDEKET
jgi:BlaI family transcriptional regulator, penicillinase repressor